MSTKLASTPIKDMDPEVIARLAERYSVSVATLRRKHVVFVADQPNVTHSSAEKTEYDPRVVRTAIITDKPVTLEVWSVGSAIKSPFDPDDASRGDTIALARAIAG